MTSILIVYDSGSGNTEKMAHAVADGVKEVEGVTVNVQRADATTNDDLLAAEGIIGGSPVYYGVMSAKLKGLFDKSVEIHEKLEGKVGGAIAVGRGTGGGQALTINAIYRWMLSCGIVCVAGELNGVTAVADKPRDILKQEKRLIQAEILGSNVLKVAKRLRG